MDVTLSGSTLTATDRANRTMEVAVVGWDETVDPVELPVDVDAVAGGRVSSLTFPDVLARHRTADTEEYETVLREEEGNGTLTLPADDHLLKLTLGLIAYLRFEGAPTLERTGDGSLRVQFDQPTPVTVGFWSMVDYPEETIAAAPTAEGLATAVSHLSSSLLTTAPDRSLPGWREHPPRIRIGEETSVPDAVREATPDTGVELAVPPSVPALFPASPIAYYVGANVVVEDRTAPVLRAPETDFRRTFSPLPAFQFEAARWFQRTFYLDCIVRSTGNVGYENVAERDVLSDVDLDPDACYEASIAERLAAYERLDDETVTDRLPSRNYAACVDPTPENATVLPFVLSNLGLVYLPDAVSDGRRPGDGDVPGTADRRRSMTAAVGVEPPDESVYWTPPEAYEHRLEHLAEGDGDVSIVVLGERDEYVGTALECYRTHQDAFEGEVTVEHRPTPTRESLAELLESRTDVVHLVADGTGAGIECADGQFRAEDLETSKARVFVLDGPETASFARSLVRAGSVVGVARGGTRSYRNVDSLRPFLRLLLQGYSVALAVGLLRGTVAPDHPYRVVGDGTHNVLEDDSVHLLPLYVEANGDRTFDVVAGVSGPTGGVTWHPTVPGVRPRLLDNDLPYTVDGVELLDQIGDPGLLVVEADELHWSGDGYPFYPIV